MHVYPIAIAGTAYQRIWTVVPMLVDVAGSGLVFSEALTAVLGHSRALSLVFSEVWAEFAPLSTSPCERPAQIC